MDSLRTIKIDFDIHQMIELERKGFDEPEYLALRRLLKLGVPEVEAETASQTIAASEGRSWNGKGVELPHGTELRMEYNGRVSRGHIDNGIWIVEGERATSPSKAAKIVNVTKDGTKPSLNGWIYWEVKRPNDTRWRRLENLK